MVVKIVFILDMCGCRVNGLRTNKKLYKLGDNTFMGYQNGLGCKRWYRFDLVYFSVSILLYCLLRKSLSWKRWLYLYVRKGTMTSHMPRYWDSHRTVRRARICTHHNAHMRIYGTYFLYFVSEHAMFYRYYEQFRKQFLAWFNFVYVHCTRVGVRNDVTLQSSYKRVES